MVEIEDKTIAEGRFIAPHEVEHAAFVCVIGADVKEKFFEGRDPIGKTLKIQNMPMTSRRRRSRSAGRLCSASRWTTTLYIPLTTFGKIFGRRQSLQLHGKAGNMRELSGRPSKKRGWRCATATS